MKITLFEKKLLRIIFGISVLATAGSLYYGRYGDPVQNIMQGELFNRHNGIPACTLCWYIRIFQFPILLLSGVGIYYADRLVARRYILPLAIIGLMISLYKWGLEEGRLVESAVCSPYGVDCSTKFIEYRGFITIPLMAIITFIVIIAACLLFRKKIGNGK